jgi:hypothetical protein
MLDNAHWVISTHKQRMTKKEWKQILLEEKDKIIFKGIVTKLKADDLGCGVVEVYKIIK